MSLDKADRLFTVWRLERSAGHHDTPDVIAARYYRRREYRGVCF